MCNILDYLSSQTKAVFWIHCKDAVPAYIFAERLGFNFLWNNTDKFTGVEQSNQLWEIYIMKSEHRYHSVQQCCYSISRGLFAAVFEDDHRHSKLTVTT